MDPLTIGIVAGIAWTGTRDYEGPGVDAPGGAVAGSDMNPPGSRGVVLSLSPAQRVARWRYLAGELTIGDLDPGVRRGNLPSSSKCPAIYYRLKEFNGGKDPAAPHPATEWRKPGSSFTNRTADCIGGAAWGAGFDRYQPARFPLYAGWINTDSMIMDAEGAGACFRKLERPEPGCFVVAKSGSYGPSSVGHIGGVVDVPGGWSSSTRAAWAALGVVDVAGRSGRANLRTTGAGWYGRGVFIVSIMK